jgi:hypothetical protein
VADAVNGRLLGFFSPRTGTSANLLIGGLGLLATPAIICNAPLALPAGLSSGARGTLWVADPLNNRVLMYKLDAATLRSAVLRVLGEPVGDAIPALVLGQPDLCTTSEALAGPNTLLLPFGVVASKDGSVWVGDTSNHRTLHFLPRLGNGMDASLVLGQPTMFASSPNQGGFPGAETQYSPWDDVNALEAGPSTLAIAVLLGLSGAWFMTRRLRRKTA